MSPRSWRTSTSTRWTGCWSGQRRSHARASTRTSSTRIMLMTVRGRSLGSSCEGSRDCLDPSGTSLGSWWLDANHQPREGTPDGQPPECPDHAAQSSRDRETPGRRGSSRPASWPRRSASASARCGNGRRGTRRPQAAGLVDRSCRPHHSPRATPACGSRPGRSPAARARWTGRPDRASPWRSAARRWGGFSGAPACRGSPGSPPPARPRYERARPGELLHLDMKKLGRIRLRASDHGRSAAPASGRLGVRARGDR